MTFLSSISGEVLRFAIVTVAGLIVDLGTAMLAAEVIGLSLPAGAAMGFFAGALFNYVCHELWTFRVRGGGLSARRAGLYLVSMRVVLGARMGVAIALSPLAVGRLSTLGVLIAAAGVSFIVNYLLSRLVVYGSRRAASTCPAQSSNHER